MVLVVAIIFGALIGWATHSFLNLNEGRGRIVAVAIGALAAVAGVKFIAPMFITVAAPGGFSVGSVVVAGIVAGVVLVVASMINSRWDI